MVHPLDATRLLTQPCSVLTPPQLLSLNLPGPGVADTDSPIATTVGPSCSWRNRPAATSIAITFLTGNKNGLSDTYRMRAQGDFPGYWLETTVDGYPAVVKDDEGSRKNGKCMMNVGITDTLAVLLDEQDRSGEKSCERVKSIASLMIETLRTG